MNPISIVIPNFQGHEAIQLCIESVRARTTGVDYEILVYDNLGDGRDREYLRKQRDAGHIKLIENDGYTRAPGLSMSQLLNRVETEFAVHIESDIEIICPDWLTAVLRLIQDKTKDIAAARYFGPKPHCNTWYAPIWGPEVILLNMPLYRQIEEPHDWQQKSIPVEQYKYRHIFNEFKPPEGFNGTVNLDTCWRFTEKMVFENKWGFMVKPLPKDYFWTKVKHFGGISTRGKNPEIQPRWEEVRRHLAILRTENG